MSILTSILILILSLPIIILIFFVLYCRQKFHKLRTNKRTHLNVTSVSSSTIATDSPNNQIPSSTTTTKSYSDNLPTKVPQPSQNQEKRIIGFFHPHCSAGGGGERVLWKAIQTLGTMQEQFMETNSPIQWEIVIYTVDPFHENYYNDIMKHVSTRFSIKFSPALSITFIHLEDLSSKASNGIQKFSMVVESWSTMELAWRALHTMTPHIFIDTTGCAFTYVVAGFLANCKVGAYVHYPTISTDMLALVWDRRPTYNNNSQITSNSFMTYVKLVYYTLFAIGYGFVGSLTDLVMVNSTWTYGHIRSLWRFARDIHIVYPPCDTKSLEDLPLSISKQSSTSSSTSPRENVILSIGQFRPEKDHELQIRSFARFMKRIHQENRSSEANDIKLVLIGSCRGSEDEERVSKLRMLAQKLEVSKQIEFVINQPFPVLKEWLGRSSIGLHTMWNEHFGIGVVEMMAAGLITIAHNTGGPKLDIVVPLEGQRTGYLASTEKEYADAMYTILFCNTIEENRIIQKFARKASKAFSDEVFDVSFKSAVVASKILR